MKKPSERIAELRKNINDALIKHTGAGRSVNFEPWSLLRDVLGTHIFSELDAKDQTIAELKTSFQIMEQACIGALKERDELKAEVKNYQDWKNQLGDELELSMQETSDMEDVKKRYQTKLGERTKELWDSKKQIADLKEKLKEVRGCDHLDKPYRELLAKLTLSELQRSKAVEALEFYSDMENLIQGFDVARGTWYVKPEYYEKAQEALTLINEYKKGSQ